MRTAKPKILTRLRSLFGALLVVSGWFAAPIALAARPADTCAMACCIKQGSCCCKIRHARVKGQLPDKGPQVDSSARVNSCPNGCANSTISIKLSFTGTGRTTSARPLSIITAEAFSVLPIFATDDLLARPSIPRAPPSSLI